MRAFTFLVKALLFVSTFSLEITVHAADKSVPIEIQTTLQEPHNCLATKDVCAVENLGETGFDVKVGDSIVTLDHGSSLIRKSDNEVRMIKGTAWIKAEKTMVVSSEYGAFQNVGSGDFWVTKTSTQVTAMAVSSDVEIKPRGSQETLLISQGLQNSLSQVGFNGQAATGIPMPIPFKDHVMRWGRLYRGPKKAFESSVDEFHVKWEAATEAAAVIHHSLYDRVIASADQEAKAEAAKKAKIEAENQALRDMFRKRILQGM
jgi:hypothetical protein